MKFFQHQLYTRTIVAIVVLLLGLFASQVFAVEDSATVSVGVSCDRDGICEPANGESNSTCALDCPAVTECNDGSDNDGDSLTDYPADPGCSSALDEDETDPPCIGCGSDPDPVTCTLTLTPSAVTIGETTTLSWSTNIASATGVISPDVGSVGATGSTILSPIESTTYTGVFTGPLATKSCEATLTVNPLPDNPGVIAFGQASYAQLEDAGIISLTLTRSVGIDGEVSVTVSSVDGSAIAPDDYIPVSQEVTWLDQEGGDKTIAITLIDDVISEGNETFSITLVNPIGGATLGIPQLATATILDDEEPEIELPTITLIKNVINDNGRTKAPADFTLTIGGNAVGSGSTTDVTPDVPLSINEVQQSGYQFVSITGSASCPSVLGATMTLSEGETATCTITNDDTPITVPPPPPPDGDGDPPPDGGDEGPTDGGDVPSGGGPTRGSIQFEASTYNISEESGSITVPVRRMGGTDGEARVTVRVFQGSALENIDYSPVSETISWEDGEGGEKLVVIPITDDTVIENEETFTIELSQPVGATLGPPPRTIVRIIDNDVECIEGVDCPPEQITEEPDEGFDFDTILPGIIDTVTEDIVPAITDFVESPIGSTTTKTVATIGVVGGGASMLSVLFGNIASLGEIAMVPLRLWSLLLSLLGLKRRHRPWGVVFDSVTKQPLDPAYVVLNDLEGKEVATSITDVDGRYGFLVGPGTYTISTRKTHYSFPSKILSGRTSDELYADLYFGGQVVIQKQGEVIASNIPMDPEDFDWNEFAKSQGNRMKFFSKRTVIFARLANLLFNIGFMVASISFVILPAPYNLAILMIYLVLLLMRILGLRPKRSGRLRHSGTNIPISFAIVRILTAQSSHEIAHRVCDQLGRYYALVPKGNYRVVIEEKQPDGTYRKTYTSSVIRAKKGIINQDFTI